MQEQQETDAQIQQLQQQNQELQAQLQTQGQQLDQANAIVEQANSEEAMYDKRVRDLDLAQKELQFRQNAMGGVL